MLIFNTHKQTIVAELRNNFSLIIRPKSFDPVVINEVIRDNIYALTPSLNEGVVIDVGAHIGAFSIYASRVMPKAKVFSFEPFPDNYELLTANIKLNGCSNITAFNQAISNIEGIQEFYFSDSKDFVTMSLHNDRVKQLFNVEPRRIYVKTRTIEQFIQEKNIKLIDFLKLDCEGAEYNILFYCSDNLLSRIKRISMEYHTGMYDGKFMNCQLMKDFLESKGFIVHVNAPIMLAFNKKYV
jgi:FkbM family methyltransferase